MAEKPRVYLRLPTGVTRVAHVRPIIRLGRYRVLALLTEADFGKDRRP